MKKAGRAPFAALAALAVLMLPAPARAAVYELASEWMTISFKDGGKDLLLFTHLPDSDIFLQMNEYFPGVSSKTANINLYVPLQELVRADSQEGAGTLVLTSRPTPYKMLIRFDKAHHHHVIQRPPDFTTHDSTTSATILSVFGVKSEHPENFLALVRPELPASPPGGLRDVELAAVDSLDASERAALVGECGGEPGAPAALGCWREKIGILLTRHQADDPSRGLSPFEQRYIQNRLSPKGYEQFQSLRSSPDAGDKLSLAGSWHRAIFDQDIAANAAAAVKIEAPSTAPIVAAAAPRVPPAAPKIKESLSRPAAVSTVRPAPPAANPAPNPAPTPVRWKIILAVFLALAVVVLASR